MSVVSRRQALALRIPPSIVELWRRRGQRVTDARKVTESDRLVGARIRRRRIHLGVSQLQLAEAIGVSTQQFQKYEDGRNRVAASRLMAIARTLSCTTSELLGGLEPFVEDKETDALPQYSPLTLFVAEAFERLPASEQLAVAQLIFSIAG